MTHYIPRKTLRRPYQKLSRANIRRHLLWMTSSGFSSSSADVLSWHYHVASSSTRPYILDQSGSRVGASKCFRKRRMFLGESITWIIAALRRLWQG